MLVHRRVTPSIKFASTHLDTWVERGTVRVKCLAQEHNTMSLATARTRSAQSGDERTNHEATAQASLPQRSCSVKASHGRWSGLVMVQSRTEWQKCYSSPLLSTRGENAPRHNALGNQFYVELAYLNTSCHALGTDRSVKQFVSLRRFD